MATLLENLAAYNEAENQIHAYFGFKGFWEVYPIDDNLEMYWCIRDRATLFAKTEADLLLAIQYESGIGEVEPKEYFSEEFARSPDESVYVGEEYTAILINTHTDGNKFMSIFDNSKRRQL